MANTTYRIDDAEATLAPWSDVEAKWKQLALELNSLTRDNPSIVNSNAPAFIATVEHAPASATSADAVLLKGLSSDAEKELYDVLFPYNVASSALVDATPLTPGTLSIERASVEPFLDSILNTVNNAVNQKNGIPSALVSDAERTGSAVAVRTPSRYASS